MTESDVVVTKQEGRAARPGQERRRHVHLRELIDEMMASLRAAANRDIFSVEERAEAQEQLARIMQRVHAEALQVGDRRNG